MAAAVKVAADEPAGMVTDEGTLKAAPLEEIVTAEPPLGAAAESVTVQVEELPDDTELGEHCTEEAAGAGWVAALTLILPPVPETETALPLGFTPRLALIGSATDPEAVEARFAVNLATTPSGIWVVLRPLAMQLRALPTVAQFRVFPAAVSEDPATSLTDTTLFCG